MEINPSIGDGFKIMTVDEWSSLWKRCARVERITQGSLLFLFPPDPNPVIFRMPLGQLSSLSAQERRLPRLPPVRLDQDEGAPLHSDLVPRPEELGERDPLPRLPRLLVAVIPGPQLQGARFGDGREKETFGGRFYFWRHYLLKACSSRFRILAQMPEDYEKERWEKDAAAHGHTLLNAAKTAAAAAASSPSADSPAPAAAPGIKAA